MIPPLPVEDIRAAIDADDWTRADALLVEHEVAVRQALATPGAIARDHAAWLDLLGAQRSLAVELQARREHASARLRQFQHDRRGASAYRAEAGA